MHDTNMKPITTEATYRQTNKWTDRHTSSVALVNGRTLKKNFPSASFFLASSSKVNCVNTKYIQIKIARSFSSRTARLYKLSQKHIFSHIFCSA